MPFSLPHQNQRLRTIFRFHHGSCQRQSQLPRPLPYLQSQILLFPPQLPKCPPDCKLLLNFQYGYGIWSRYRVHVAEA